ncbi:hypothetical protein ACE6H2_003695 [Prunus campanulata]
MPSLKPADAPIFFPSSDLTMERGRKRRKKMDENGSSPLKQPREKALSAQKFMILWDWAEFWQIDRSFDRVTIKLPEATKVTQNFSPSFSLFIKPP